MAAGDLAPGFPAFPIENLVRWLARSPTFRHNKRMRSNTFGLVVWLAVVAAWSGGTFSSASASEPELHAAITVRASGKSGEVTRTKQTAKQARAEAGLPAQIEGGSIPRGALKAELGKGIGRFFQQVRPEPVISRGRVVGWRVATLFANRTDVKVSGVQIGDIVLRVNGESVERPEDFKAVWDSLGDAKQLVIDIERGGETTRVHYTIAD
jgi:type II secretory pathway component PulC